MMSNYLNGGMTIFSGGMVGLSIQYKDFSMEWLIALLIAKNLLIESGNIFANPQYNQSEFAQKNSSDSSLTGSSASFQEWYATYHQSAHSLYQSTINNNIKMMGLGQGKSVTRPILCQFLVSQHNQLHRDFFDLELSASDCIEALRKPRGYSSNESWSVWAGYHRGTWFHDGKEQWQDNALWDVPHPQATLSLSQDLDRECLPRIYDFQAVEFQGSRRTNATRDGWNISHPEIPYVLGFDRKDDNMSVDRATHIGFPFQKRNASCLIWITSDEAFLECIRDVTKQGDSSRQNNLSQRRRVSTGILGYGRWNVL